MELIEILALLIVAPTLFLNTAQFNVKRPVTGPRFGIFTERGFYWIPKPSHLPPMPKKIPTKKNLEEEVDSWIS